MAALGDVEEVQPPHALKRRCRPKLVLSDSSAEESEAFGEVPKKGPRVKPPASRYGAGVFSYLVFSNPS